MNLVRFPIILNKRRLLIQIVAIIVISICYHQSSIITTNIVIKFNLGHQHCHHRAHDKPESLLDVLHVHLNTVLEHL